MSLSKQHGEGGLQISRCTEYGSGMQPYPAWKMNIVIFIAIAAMVGGYSFWQVQRASRQFVENSREHARVVAAVVELALEDLPQADQGSADEVPQVGSSAARLLERLNRLPGIARVDLQDLPQTAENAENEIQTRLFLTEGRRVTETRIPLAGRTLVISLPAAHFTRRIQQMKGEFMLFTVCILLFGGISTWWLYRTQQQRIQEAREFEQRIARQHEEAALGRAAATIAHEIRNPLNAIGMGLQRLEMEAAGLEPEHLGLVAGMREAVARSNAIVSDLKCYVGDYRPVLQQVNVAGLLGEVTRLYSPQCAAAGIVVNSSIESGVEIEGDARLLGQLFENLWKNAVEAQPRGGRIAVSCEVRQNICRLVMENDGFILGSGESDNIFEPYFTTKTQGTGLGLAISKKIVEAHGGRIIRQSTARSQVFRLVIDLPVRQNAPLATMGGKIHRSIR